MVRGIEKFREYFKEFSDSYIIIGGTACDIILEFPKQVELFSRIPDLLDLDDDTHLTPIPVDDDISSLSAILLDEDYYNYTLQHSIVEYGVHIANIEALICLKAKAFLDMSMRKANGEKIDEKNIRKHKTDVFRMAVMLTAENMFELPVSIQADLQNFVDEIKSNLPGKEMFKDMGLSTMPPEKVFQQLLKNFQLEGE